MIQNDISQSYFRFKQNFGRTARIHFRGSFPNVGRSKPIPVYTKPPHDEANPFPGKLSQFGTEQTNMSCAKTHV
jgi:hypothetical protein